MIVDFGSCLHHEPRTREVQVLERPAGELARTGPHVPVPDGSAVEVGGAAWIVQTGAPDGVSLGLAPGRLLVRARTGERAAFDPPRKIRAELCGARRFGPGEPIVLEGILRIEAGGTLADADWCSLLQIHQADTRRADGRFVESSPLFSLGLRRGEGGRPHLVVTGETGRGVPQPGTFSPARTFVDVPFTLGRDHRFALQVIDGHGGPGRIRVVVDDRILVDRSDIAVGYDYVDLLAEAGGSRQSTGSYLKMGVYAGRFDGDVPPRGFRIDLSLRDLSTGTRP